MCGALRWRSFRAKRRPVRRTGRLWGRTSRLARGWRGRRVLRGWRARWHGRAGRRSRASLRWLGRRRWRPGGQRRRRRRWAGRQRRLRRALWWRHLLTFSAAGSDCVGIATMLASGVPGSGGGLGGESRVRRRSGWRWNGAGFRGGESAFNSRLPPVVRERGWRDVVAGRFLSHLAHMTREVFQRISH